VHQQMVAGTANLASRPTAQHCHLTNSMTLSYYSLVIVTVLMNK